MDCPQITAYARLRGMGNQMTLLPGGQPFYLQGSDRIGCVFVHGYTGTPCNMRWMADAVHSKLGATIYAPRLAGHGTRPQDMLGVRWEEWYLDVVAAYQMLRDRCERVFAVGLSMGAALSLLLASNEAVDGVVALSTPHGIYDRRMPLLPLISLMLPYRTKIESDETLAWRRFVDEEAPRRSSDPFGYAAYDVYPTASLMELDQLLGAMRDGLPCITAPAMLIHSQRDDVVPYAQLQLTLDKMTGTQPKVITIADSLHVITMDCECDMVFDFVAGFIREHA